MSNELLILLFSAFTIGLMHTLMGPDHYIPFIAMSKARKWSLSKTSIITTICGIGHVMSAFAIGVVAVLLGMTAAKLQFIETYRGSVAAWFLILFGLLYFIWSVRAIARKKKHTHFHAHIGGMTHEHLHSHKADHVHIHAKEGKRELTPWILFIIFILGPCEPLIPLIMYPAIQGSMTNVLLITLFFGIATLTAMLSVVILAVSGIKLVKCNFLEKYGNAMAGVVICGAGLAIKFLGL